MGEKSEAGEEFWRCCWVPPGPLRVLTPPQAESINIKMTRGVKSSAVDLFFTQEGAARRELGVIYNLLLLDAWICSMTLINNLWTAQLRRSSFLSATPPFRTSAGYCTLVYWNSRSISVKYCTLFWLICQDI